MKICKEVERRRKILEQAKRLKEKGLNLREISKIIGGSERTIKRWRKGKKDLEIRGLVPLSKKPKRLVEQRILFTLFLLKVPNNFNHLCLFVKESIISWQGYYLFMAQENYEKQLCQNSKFKLLM
ncbi:MAG: helix-turn-helix domain-containing protein [Endomicrobium sp.]|jgi:hypothetical protein|nr:helix-turn-helix domain-containing protein [Endomicrobium sp.]